MYFWSVNFTYGLTRSSTWFIRFYLQKQIILLRKIVWETCLLVANKLLYPEFFQWALEVITDLRLYEPWKVNGQKINVYLFFLFCFKRLDHSLISSYDQNKEKSLFVKSRLLYNTFKNFIRPFTIFVKNILKTVSKFTIWKFKDYLLSPHSNIDFSLGKRKNVSLPFIS